MATEVKDGTPGTAVATRQPGQVEALITSERARSYIEPFLPKGTDIQRVAGSVMLAMRNDATGALRKCSQESLVLGVARIMQWGLELGVTAHLIPFKGKAVPVADYKGLCELMISSRAVRYVEAREVREGDEFKYHFGLNSVLEHRPVGGKSTRAKQPITHVYCIIHLPFGRTAFDVMTADEVEEVRQNHSKQWKTGPLPGWYARKTIIRRVAKTLPKSPELARFFNALATDEIAVDRPEDLEPGAPAAAARISDDEDRPQSSIDVTDWPEDTDGDGSQGFDDTDLDR